MDPDSTITFKLNNPLVSELGLFSYPLTVPYQENKHVFNFPGEGNATPENYDFELFIGSERFIDGEVQIVNAHGIELYFKSGSSSVASLLRSTCLDEPLNGNSYGQFIDQDDLAAQKQAALAGKYPLFNFASPVIKTPEKIEQRVCFYLRFLLRKVVSNLGYLIEQDQSLIVEDFNRLFLFANKRFIPRVSVIPYTDYLPHISVYDFLKDVQNRFNLFIYISPFNRKAYILLLDTVMDAEASDWSPKFIENEDYEKYDIRNISFENKGEDEDVLTDQDIQEIIYTNTADSPQEFKYIIDKQPLEEIIYLLNSNNRVYKGTRYSPSQSFPDDYYLRKSTFSSVWKTMGIGYSGEYSESATNTGTNADSLNLIRQFAFPEWEGVVNDVVYLNLWAKKDQPGDYRLIGILYESTDQDAEILAFCEVPIVDTDELQRRLVLFLNRKAELETTSRMALKIFEYHPSGVAAGTITIKYGGVEYGTGLRRESLLLVDRGWFKFREYGLIGNFTTPTEVTKETFEYKPTGRILTNTIDKWSGMTYPMAETNLKREKQPKEYAWSIHRGLINNELFRHKSIESQFGDHCPFACYDDKDGFHNDYQDRLINNDPPTLSLRWSGANGLINRCFSKTLPWKRYFSRKVTKRLSLSVNDIINTDLYKPVKIGSQKYLISELSIPIKANGNIGEVTAELLTI